MEDSNKYYYPNENNYGYPPAGNNNYEQYPPQQSTPLPQRVASIANDYSTMIDNSTPPAVNNIYAMPTPHYQQQYPQDSVYPPVQYHHQRNISQGTASPPGSPPRYPQTQAQPYQTISGYSDATQEMITNSFRPAFAHNVSDSSTNVSTHSSLNTPPLPPTNSGFRTPPVPNQQVYNQQTRRNPSSLRSNVIMTIERPRYDYLPESENPDDGEVPFIPVSPDTDSDEEYFPSTVAKNPPQPYHVNEYSREEYTAPVDHQPVEPPQTSGMSYNDPTQFYVYPPPIDPAKLPPQVPVMIHKDVQDDASILTHHQELIREIEPIREQGHMREPEPIREQEHIREPEPIRQQEEIVVVEEIVPRIIEPNYGLFSVLSTAFIRHVKGLENVRELWCASEYNESFTGSEAVVKY